MKKAVGYIRRTASKEYTETQRKVISEWCEKNDYEVIEWIEEKGFDAVAYGNWMGHRKIDAVVASSNVNVSGEFDKFYAYKCKMRLRNSDLVVVHKEAYAGYAVYEGILERMVDTFCRMEIEHEPVRNENGRMRKVAKGGYIGGQPPMGYKVEDGRLVINPEEVPVVQCIMDRKRSGKTMISTVDVLNQNGYKTRRGGKFVISTVQSIWNNEKFYQGYYKYGKGDEWVPGQHEAILKD